MASQPVERAAASPAESEAKKKKNVVGTTIESNSHQWTKVVKKKNKKKNTPKQPESQKLEELLRAKRRQRRQEAQATSQCLPHLAVNRALC